MIETPNFLKGLILFFLAEHDIHADHLRSIVFQDRDHIGYHMPGPGPLANLAYALIIDIHDGDLAFSGVTGYVEPHRNLIDHFFKRFNKGEGKEGEIEKDGNDKRAHVEVSLFVAYLHLFEI